MGLKWRGSLFYGVHPCQVYDVFVPFWNAVGHPLYEVSDDEVTSRIELYEPNNGWTVLHWGMGWEYCLRRQVQMLVSTVLECSGIFIVARDGYWGYELFRDGIARDHFMQEPSADDAWFPRSDCRGQPAALSAEFPWISVSDAASYLVRDPEDWDEREGLNVPARPGDEFRRFDSCAFLDFIRLLGVDIALQDHMVTVQTPAWRVFALRGWSPFPVERRLVTPTSWSPSSGRASQ